ncbi:GNAT family N-acetyltransferase [Paludibacterium purpuratum]|nr:N-acetyltransferase [Paludibacterium purpuratum]
MNAESKSMTITLRQEQSADCQAIFELTRTAFLTAPHTSHTEQFIVDALRHSGQLALSLVAVDGDHLVGHVALSPVELSTGASGWYGVGPISVDPGRQRQGIGSLLMRQALNWLQAQHAAGCVLVGDPGYYARFDFFAHPDLIFPGIPAEYFLIQAFGGSIPKATVAFHPAFSAIA